MTLAEHTRSRYLSTAFARVAGPVVGWDVADDNNDKLSWTGQVALTAFRDLTTSLNWITGPEQPKQGELRTVPDFVANYTGVKSLTLGANVDYGWEDDEASLVASGTRSNNGGWSTATTRPMRRSLRSARPGLSRPRRPRTSVTVALYYSFF